MAIADNAAFYRRAGAILDTWGWGKYIDWYSGWATRSNAGATMPPQGVTIHHTGGRATATSYLIDPRDRPQLKVLANIHISHDHRIKFICAGGASHGGYTYKACYDRIIAGDAPLDRDLAPGPDSSTFSINKRTVGIEVDGAGGKNEWDEWTYRAAVATSAALHLAGKWPLGKAPRVGAHKEHTKRKPGDPYAPMGQFRKDVLACLKAPWGPTGDIPKPEPTKPLKLGDRILSQDGNDKGADVAELARLLNSKGYSVGLPMDTFGPMMDKAVRAFQERAGLTVDGVVGPETIAALKAPVEEPKPVDPPPVTPEPEPAPIKLKTFTVLQANLQAKRWGGLAASSPKRADLVKSAKADILIGSEMEEDARIKTFGLLGAWKNYPIGYTTVGWNPKKFTHRARKSEPFGKSPYHGAVRAELDGLDVISIHVRPRDAFTSDAAAAKGKQADIAAGLKLVRKGVPTILGGDFSTTKTDLCKQAGLRLAVTKQATWKSSFLDQVWVSPEVIVKGARLISTTGISDHKAWAVDVAIPA